MKGERYFYFIPFLLCKIYERIYSLRLVSLYSGPKPLNLPLTQNLHDLRTPFCHAFVQFLCNPREQGYANYEIARQYIIKLLIHP